MIKNPYYIYRHIRPDTNEVFYIGKGTNRRNKYSYERATVFNKRNTWWEYIFNKCGGVIIVEILIEFDCTDKCVAKEKEMIALYGRRDLGKGTLVNLTDGGDGSWGHITSEVTRAKRRILSSGPRSQKWIDSIRAARKNGGNGGVVCKGDKLSASWRKNISEGQKGPNNYMRGRTGAKSHVSRKVLDQFTGVVYDSISIAAESNNYNMKTLYNWLSGHRNNPTTLVFA